LINNTRNNTKKGKKMKTYKINLTLVWRAENENEVKSDLLDETDNPDSILFKTLTYSIKEVEDVDD